MDYKDIDKLVELSLQGDKTSTHELIKIFEPIVKNVSARYSLIGHEYMDIYQECYLALLCSLEKYNPSTGTFLKYGYRAITHHIFNMIRDQVRHKEDMDYLGFEDKLKFILQDTTNLEDDFIIQEQKKILQNSFKTLTFKEVTMIDFLYYKNKTLSQYARLNMIPYSLARSQRRTILQKLKTNLLKSNFLARE